MFERKALQFGGEVEQAAWSGNENFRPLEEFFLLNCDAKPSASQTNPDVGVLGEGLDHLEHLKKIKNIINKIIYNIINIKKYNTRILKKV